MRGTATRDFGDSLKSLPNVEASGGDSGTRRPAHGMAFSVAVNRGAGLVRPAVATREPEDKVPVSSELTRSKVRAGLGGQADNVVKFGSEVAP